MAETVMTIFWNVFQQDCQIDMCDVIVDWPQLPSEYSHLMSPHSLLRATLYFLIHFFSTLHPLTFWYVVSVLLSVLPLCLKLAAALCGIS